MKILRKSEGEKFLILPELHYNEKENRFCCPDPIDEEKLELHGGAMF